MLFVKVLLSTNVTQSLRPPTGQLMNFTQANHISKRLSEILPGIPGVMARASLGLI